MAAEVAGDRLGVDWALAWVRGMAGTVQEHRDELVELDRVIGDGDHGENLARGFTAVVAKLESSRSEGTAPADVGEVLRLLATTLMSTVGGAAGPLYGTAFLRAAKTAGSDLDAGAVAALLEAALEGIVARGKAEVGEKTMVDAWSPAADAAAAAAQRGESPARALADAAAAARAGAESTDPLIARKGRASYLGQRAVGHRDPGAESSALLLAAAAAAASP